MYASSAVNAAPAATVAPARLSVTEMPDGVGAAVGTGAATGASVGLGAGLPACPPARLPACLPGPFS